MNQLRSVGQRARDANAHQRVLAGIQQIASLLGLPDSLSELLEKARHRDAFMQMMLQREALADTVEGIVAGLEEREGVLAQNADLPEDLPGRNALVRAGVISLAALRQKSREDLVSMKGIGDKRAREIISAIPKAQSHNPADTAKLTDLRDEIRTLRAEVKRLTEENARLSELPMTVTEAPPTQFFHGMPETEPQENAE